MSTGHYILGVLLVFATAWSYAFIMSFTRKLKHIHFAYILFYYGLTASSIYVVWITIEYSAILIKAPPSEPKPWPRLLSYGFKQYALLALVSMLNIISKNLETMAFQYEKSAFISLVGYS